MKNKLINRISAPIFALLLSPMGYCDGIVYLSNQDEVLSDFSDRSTSPLTNKPLDVSKTRIEKRDINSDGTDDFVLRDSYFCGQATGCEYHIYLGDKSVGSSKYCYAGGVYQENLKKIVNQLNCQKPYVDHTYDDASA